jgi:hypothetical protein
MSINSYKTMGKQIGFSMWYNSKSDWGISINLLNKRFVISHREY